MSTENVPNGNGTNVSLKWLAGILTTLVLALITYFVTQKDNVLRLHDEGIRGNSDRINVLYERVIRLESKLDVANDKLDMLLRSRTNVATARGL